MSLRIIFTGGGTLGSVTPLIGVYEELLARHGTMLEARWFGTRSGPERAIVQRAGINFTAIAGGKLRRYFSLQTLIDPFFIIAGFFQSLFHLIVWRPHVMVSAGSFIAVPVLWAGRLLGIRSVVLQLDLLPGLANKLTEQGACKIGVAFKDEVRFFEKKKVTVVGIPVRSIVRKRAAMSERERVALKKQLGLAVDMPAVLVLGGGTGSLALNDLVIHALPKLMDVATVVHITGIGKEVSIEQLPTRKSKRYVAFPLLGEEIVDYMAVVDCVVSRAGMGTLAELSALGKPTILIPLPQSHQEDNAMYFQNHNAVLYLKQEDATPERLVLEIEGLLSDERRLAMVRSLQAMLPIAATSMVSDMVEEASGLSFSK